MNKSLNWWKKRLSVRLRKIIAKTWILGLIITVLFFINALIVSVTGIQGMSETQISSICFISLLISIVFYNYTFMAGYAYDIEKNKLP